VVLAIDVKIYVESFPLRNHPGNKIFKRLVEGLKETGSLKPKTKDVVNKPITNELNKAIVLNYADNSHHIGILAAKLASANHLSEGSCNNTISSVPS
jgi:hypothetical protein